MKISEQLFEDVLSSKLKGRFVLRDGKTYKSEYLRKNTTGGLCSSHPYRIYATDNVAKVINASYTPDGMFLPSGEEYDMDIIDFIPETNMETKELKIEVPEGFEIDKENSSFEKIVFKKKEDTKPRSWEKYCESKKDEHGIGYFIGSDSDICNCNWGSCATPSTWRNMIPSKELTEAFLTMMQLMSLRQEWIHRWSVEQNLPEDWKPNWLNTTLVNYCIEVDSGEIVVYPNIHSQAPLSFPTVEMAKDFKNCFIDMLEIAKPLI